MCGHDCSQQQHVAHLHTTCHTRIKQREVLVRPRFVGELDDLVFGGYNFKGLVEGRVGELNRRGWQELELHMRLIPGLVKVCIQLVRAPASSCEQPGGRFWLMRWQAREQGTPYRQAACRDESGEEQELHSEPWHVRSR